MIWCMGCFNLISTLKTYWNCCPPTQKKAAMILISLINFIWKDFNSSLSAKFVFIFITCSWDVFYLVWVS